MRAELRKEFNAIQFEGLETAKCGDALYHVEYRVRRGRALKCWLDIVMSIFFSKVQIDKQDEGKIMFLFSNSYAERTDIWNWFVKTCGLAKSKVIVRPGKYKVTWKNLKYIKFFFLWCRAIKGITQINKIEKLYFLTELFKAAVDVWEIKDWMIKNHIPTKLLVVVYDGHLIDSLLVQVFNMLDIETASLQHGNYSAKQNNWGFVGSPSKYILVYGQYTKNAGLKCGVAEKRLIPLGMPQYIEKEIPKKLQLNNRGKFGIILNGGQMVEENRKLLKLAEVFAKKHGVTYNVKLHPAVQRENNSMLTELKFVDEIYQNEVDIIQFAKTIDYAIINESTVFYDYIFNFVPVFIYEMNLDMFEDITWCKFRNVSELEKLVNTLVKDKEMLEQKFTQTRAYVCKSGEIAENYQNFFRKYEN